jgi:MFS family permease
MARFDPDFGFPMTRVQEFIATWPRRRPVYYGWIMLPIATLGAICSSPGQTFTVSVFNPSFREALGLSHTQLSGAYMLGTLLAAVPLYFIGGLMDRIGIRRTLGAIVVLLALACFFTSQVTGLAQLLLAFFLLRLLGQGSMTLLSANTLAMWFHRRLGTVSGLMNLGTAASFAFVPPMVLAMIHANGWRWTYGFLGVAVAAIMLPLAAVLFRNRPEDIGQLIDGDKAPEPDEDRPPPAAAAEFTLAQSLRTRAYWILLLTGMVWGLIGTSLFFHLIPLVQSKGMDEHVAAGVYPAFALTMAAIQFAGGILADRVPLNRLLAVSVAGMCATLLLALASQGPTLTYAFAFVGGASQGLLMAVGATAWPRYFGRAHIGRIRGSTMTAMVAATAAGPYIMGAMFDAMGSFDASLIMFLVLAAPLTIAALFATPPTVIE